MKITVIPSWTLFWAEGNYNFSNWTKHPTTTRERHNRHTTTRNKDTYRHTCRHADSQTYTRTDTHRDRPIHIPAWSLCVPNFNFIMLLFRRRSSVVVAFDAFGFWLSLSSSSLSFGIVCCGCRFFYVTSDVVIGCCFLFVRLLRNKKKGTERWEAGGGR